MGKQPAPQPDREDFVHALREVDTFMDITPDDLVDLNRRAAAHARVRTTETLLVRDLMHHPVHTVGPETTLAAAAHILVEQRISGLPVVDHEDRLAGIITEADFLRAVGVPSHHPTHNLWQTLENLFIHHDEVREPEGAVAELMVSDVVTVAPDDTLHDVVDAMKRHRIKRVVVVDAGRRVVGMITRSDLVRVFFDRMRGQSPGEG
ncbi:MAG: CBS domain-containing protein [Gammaproteobacteria bacterium]|nr:CBS domain-containing protein [Gammaproteobacteria bacterium]